MTDLPNLIKIIGSNGGSIARVAPLDIWLKVQKSTTDHAPGEHTPGTESEYAVWISSCRRHEWLDTIKMIINHI